MARSLDQLIRQRFGDLEWDQQVLTAELDKLRDQLAETQAKLSEAEAKIIALTPKVDDAA